MKDKLHVKTNFKKTKRGLGSVIIIFKNKEQHQDVIRPDSET